MPDIAEEKEERMKELRAKVITHSLIFVITLTAAFFGWWEFGFYFGALIVAAASLVSDIIEELCGKGSGWFIHPSLAGHIVYWLILAYILRGLWEPFGGIFG